MTTAPTFNPARLWLAQAFRVANSPHRLRLYVRAEYRHLRKLGLDREAAKGTIARTLALGVEQFSPVGS